MMEFLHLNVIYDVITEKHVFIGYINTGEIKVHFLSNLCHNIKYSQAYNTKMLLSCSITMNFFYFFSFYHESKPGLLHF